MIKETGALVTLVNNSKVKANNVKAKLTIKEAETPIVYNAIINDEYKLEDGVIYVLEDSTNKLQAVLGDGEHTWSTSLKVGGDTDVPTVSWEDITDKPVVIAEGATETEARDAIGAGTSDYDLPVGGTATTFLAGDNTWKTPPNTTYSIITDTEFNTGTATTARTVSAQSLNRDINKLLNQAHGWAIYNDSLYTSASPLVINQGVRTKITNNATTVINTQLPEGVTSWWNSTTNKLTPSLDGDSYLVNLRFTAQSSSTSGLADVELDVGGALGVIDGTTVSLRKGAGNSQRVSIKFDLYSSATFIANGGEFFLNSLDGNTSIYDIRLKITRVHKAK